MTTAATAAVATPARIRASAVAELKRVADGPLMTTTLITAMVRICTAPTEEGVPLGPCENVYYRRVGTSGLLILYTVGEHRSVTVEAIVKAVGL